MTSVRHQILLNGFAQVLSKAVRVADQLLLVPFFLSAWGVAYYGEWLTLTAIPSILAFADFGLGTAASNSFVLSYSSGEKQKSADIITTGFRVITLSIISGILVSVIILLFAWYCGWLSKTLIQPEDAILALVFLLGSRLVSFYSQLYEGLYRSVHKADLSVHLHTVQGVIQILVGIIILMAGQGIVAYSFSLLIITTIFNIVYAKWGYYLVKDLHKGDYVRLIAYETLKKGLGYLASPVWQSLYFQGSTLLVRIILGPQAVALFNTLRTLSRSVNQIFSMINASIFPELQIALGEGKRILAQKLFRSSVLTAFTASALGVAFLAIFGLKLYDIWTRHSLEVPETLWYILLVGIVFNSIWWTSSVVFKAVNQPYLFAVYGIVSALLSLIVTVYLSYSIGLYGAFIGYVLLDVVMMLLVYPTSCKMMGLNVLLK